MKAYLEVISPREVFRKNFRNVIIEGANLWILMLENRNRTSYAYD